MKGNRYDSRRHTFQPSVGLLEGRNLMSVGGVTARVRPAAQLGGMVTAASNSHKTPMVMPLRMLAGRWANQTWVSKAFADMYPTVPAYSQSIDTNRLVGHSIVSTDSVGEFVAEWSITPRPGGLMLRVKPSHVAETVEMPGVRIGPSTWVFETMMAQASNSETPVMKIRSVINIANRNTYSFSNFVVTSGVEQLLYVSSHSRLPMNYVPLQA